MYNTGKKTFARRIEALVLALCLALSLLPAFEIPVEAAYSDAAMDQLKNWGIIQGYPDGELHPEGQLTRAQFVAMVNRAYGYKDSGPIPFEDVPETSWYTDDIGIAYNAGYFNGISQKEAGPTKTLTREQAVVMLARNMRLDPIAGEVTEFTDGHDFSSWSHGLSRAAARSGIIGGFSDGSFKPLNEITRGEMAVMLTRALGSLINQPGVHTLSDTYGNVTINSPNTTLKDSTIAGNLYITGGLELGDVTLDNVRVLGDIIVSGGGESESGKDSIILRNVEADSLLVDSIADQYVSIRAEGNTSISETILRSNAYVQDRTRPGEGLLNITLDSADPEANFTLSGNLETVVNRTPNSTLNISMGIVNELTIDEHAKNSLLNLDINSTALTLNLDTAAHVTGVGDIGTLVVSAPGSVVDILPDAITIRPGLTATIAGEVVDAQKAQESSSDPRLLAGYPKLKNIASTSATALFAGNKAGTVYWAVSTSTDGSIPEDELIDPTEGNTRIALRGTTPLAKSNEEASAALSALVPDSNYYLSAVMTDAHGRHSPVKVASFKTPDNTVPAFTSGYPKVTQNDFELVTTTVDGEDKTVPAFHVQIGVMPNKSCQLYYALYPQGSVAPTGQQFRTGALGRPIQSGVTDVTKNVVDYLDFNKLDELKTYDLYLWLTDADGKLSSAVQKLTFKTVDGTAPEFQYETPLISDVAATAVKMTVNLTEDATVFWVIVQHEPGVSYLKSSDDWSEERWIDNAKRQIESGTNGVRKGSVKAKADTDVVINISGLKAATNYDIYFVAKDNAGNYSVIIKDEPATYMLQTNTLDTTAPTVEQEFTRVPENNPETPLANTDIYLVFSEDVMQFTPNQSRVMSEYVTFDTLYDAVKNAATDSERALAKDALGSALRSTIKLYNAAGNGTETVADRITPGNTLDWVIDYREARIERHPQKGTMMVVFPSTTNSAEEGNGALNLSSGATYYFVIDDIADTSSARNRMARTTLPRFTTISAQVTLNAINVTSITDENGDIIPIDMAFSMTPVSTNVERSVEWDIILWSDTSCAFQIYELQGDDNNATGNPVINTTTSDVASIGIINDNGGGGYIGRSLFRDLYKLNFNPSVTGLGKVLTDSGSEYVDNESGIMRSRVPKNYGIHFTEVKHSAESDPTRPNGDPSKAWDATVNFKISVLTGSSVDLGNLSSNITATTLEEYKKDWGVAEIHSPNPFSMRKQFSNTSAPNFAEGYPQVIATDITATMRVMLDRAGTLYYAVAPVAVTGDENNRVYTPSILTVLDVDGTPQSVTSENIGLIKDGGNSSALAIQPSPDRIYTPNFGNDAIQSGKLTMGTGYKDIPLKDLQTDTLYFVYFVTQGQGQVYSEQVMLYQFTTEKVNRPKLWMDISETYGNSGVTVVSRNMNASADFALFMMSNMPEQLLRPFSEVVDPEIENIPSQYLASTYTVSDALTGLNMVTGGSVYDEYASVTEKENLRKIILGQIPVNGYTKGKQLNLTEAKETDVDCTKAPYNIETDQNYMLISVAKSRASNANVSADAYGFAAYQPVYRRDSAPPVITDISGHLVVDYTKVDRSYVIIGEINLRFDKDLYLYKKSETQRTHLDNTNKEQFQQLNSSGTPADSGTIRVESIIPSSTGDSVQLQVSYPVTSTEFGGETWVYAREGNYFLANQDLASIYSTPAAQGLRLTLNYNKSKNEITATITPAKTWYPSSKDGKYVFTLSPDDVITDTVDVEEIRLDHSTLDLEVNESQRVTATVLPTDATDRSVTWEIDDAKVARITSSGNTPASGTVTGGYAVVQGLKEGTTTLRARSTQDDSIIKECVINVEPNVIKVTKVTLQNDAGDVIGVTGSTGQVISLTSPYRVTVTLDPSDADILTDTTNTLPNVTVNSSNQKAARPGNVSPSFNAANNEYWFTLDPGTATSGTESATITVRSRDGGATATFSVVFTPGG